MRENRRLSFLRDYFRSLSTVIKENLPSDTRGILQSTRELISCGFHVTVFLKNQGCRREKPHPVNLSPTVKQGWRDIKRKAGGGHWTGRKGTREVKGGKRAAGKRCSWRRRVVVGLNPQACKSCACPASRAKKTWSQQQRHQRFHEWKTFQV